MADDFLSVLGEQALPEMDKYTGKVQTLKDLVISTNQELVKIMSSLGKGKEYKDFIANMEKAEKLKDKMTDASIKYEKALLAEAKAQELNARAALATSKAEEIAQRIADNAEKQAAKKQAQVDKELNAYEQLKKSYTALANEAKRLQAEEIALGNATGQFSAKTLEAVAAAKKQYDSLLLIEKGVGQAQRQVGQYNMVGASFNQLLREAPAFANGMRVGLSALSNNITYFAEAIQRSRAEGASWGTVIKSIGTSMFGLVGVLNIAVLGIQLLQQHFEKSGNSVSAAEKATKKYEETIKNLDETSRTSTQAEVARLEVLNSIATDTAASAHQRQKAVDELQKLYPAYLKNIDDEAIKNGLVRDTLNDIVKALFAKAAAEAAEKKFAAASEKAYDLLIAERKALKDLAEARRQLNEAKKQGTSFADLERGVDFVAEAQKSVDIAQAARNKISAQLDLARTEQYGFLQDAKDFASKAGDLFIDEAKGVKGKTIFTHANEQIAKLNVELAKPLPSNIGVDGYQAKLIDLSEDAKRILDLIQKINKAMIAEDEAARIKHTRELYDEFARGTVGLSDIITEKQQSNLDKRVEQLDAQSQAEINAINLTTATQEEKTQRIAAVEKNALAQKIELEKQKQALEKRSFIIDKVATLGRIVLSTQESAAKIQAQSAVYTAALQPELAAAALAQLPLVYASGAISAGLIAAQIIAYAKGTPKEGHKGGAALVGEAGMELVIPKTGAPFVVDKATIIPDFEKGSHVIPQHKLDMVAAASGMMTGQLIRNIQQGNDSAQLLKAIHGLTDTVRNKPETQFVLDGLRVEKIVTHGNNRTTYLSKNVFD